MTRSAEATDTVKNFVSTGSSECEHMNSTGTSVYESAGSQAKVSYSKLLKRKEGRKQK